jgi:hypothetical protein
VHGNYYRPTPPPDLGPLVAVPAAVFCSQQECVDLATECCKEGGSERNPTADTEATDNSDYCVKCVGFVRDLLVS